MVFASRDEAVLIIMDGRWEDTVVFGCLSAADVFDKRYFEYQIVAIVWRH